MEVWDAIAQTLLSLLLGAALRATGLLKDNAWRGVERLTYFVLLPVLIVASIAPVDLGSDAITAIFLPIGMAQLMATAGVYVGLRGRIDRPALTSYVQGAVRANSFVALSISATLPGPDSKALGVLAVTALVLFGNIISVFSLLPLGRSKGPRAVAISFFANPVIAACLLGLGLNVLGLMPTGPASGPAGTIVQSLAAAALPLGLLSAGASVRFEPLRRDLPAHLAFGLLRLLMLPLLVFIGASLIGGAPGITAVACLCAAAPIASQSYLLARQMGGNAELLSAQIAATTILSFLTVPLVLWLLSP